MKMWTWPYPLSTWRYIGEYLYRDESGHEEDRITEANEPTFQKNQAC